MSEKYRVYASFQRGEEEIIEEDMERDKAVELCIHLRRDAVPAFYAEQEELTVT